MSSVKRLNWLECAAQTDKTTWCIVGRPLLSLPKKLKQNYKAYPCGWQEETLRRLSRKPVGLQNEWGIKISNISLTFFFHPYPFNLLRTQLIFCYHPPVPDPLWFGLLFGNVVLSSWLSEVFLCVCVTQSLFFILLLLTEKTLL